jgi:hypothetical protein
MYCIYALYDCTVCHCRSVGKLLLLHGLIIVDRCFMVRMLGDVATVSPNPETHYGGLQGWQLAQL